MTRPKHGLQHVSESEQNIMRKGGKCTHFCALLRVSSKRLTSVQLKVGCRSQYVSESLFKESRGSLCSLQAFLGPGKDSAGLLPLYWSHPHAAEWRQAQTKYSEFPQDQHRLHYSFHHSVNDTVSKLVNYQTWKL